ncbi:MAG TPA: stage III sporulation protein AF [Clostridiaceae bacterium]|nr:stage III sporulation protein AF [Clostridiaceae bacterium]
MVEFLKGWVLNIITLVMFLVLLEILIPSGKLKKFINLVSGFILIIVLIEPFAGNALDSRKLEDFQIINSKVINEKELEYNSKIMEEEQMKQVSEVYKKKLTDNIVQRLEKVDGISNIEAEILIDEDYTSNTFGEIKKVFIKFNIEEEAGNSRGNIFRVERIEIKDSEDFDEEQIVNEKIKDQVEEIISRLLEIDSEDIIISVEKRPANKSQEFLRKNL